MADNSTLPVAGGTEVFANDDISSVKYPRVKATWGPDGTANDADIASGKPLPIQVRSATGLILFGEPTDAKSTSTDTTSVSGISIWKQISASVQLMVFGAGTAAAAQRMTLASDDPAVTLLSRPTATARLASAAASTNATNVKTTAGTVFQACGRNNVAYDVWLVLYDAATNPPVPGTTAIRKKIVCPAGQAFIYDFVGGITFATGIGYAFTKLVADADTTVLVAADITGFNLDYT